MCLHCYVFITYPFPGIPAAVRQISSFNCSFLVHTLGLAYYLQGKLYHHKLRLCSQSAFCLTISMVWVSKSQCCQLYQVLCVLCMLSVTFFTIMPFFESINQSLQNFVCCVFEIIVVVSVLNSFSYDIKGKCLHLNHFFA